MSGLNNGSDGVGWKDVGLQEVIAGEVQGGIEGGELLSALGVSLTDVHNHAQQWIAAALSNDSIHTNEYVFRLAYGNIPEHHKILEQIFVAIERGDWINKTLLVEVLQATEETKSYEATAGKALECLFWMEKIGQHKEHSTYMEAVNTVKQFLPEALKIKANHAYDYIMNWRTRDFEPAKKTIENTARDSYFQAVKNNASQTFISNILPQANKESSLLERSMMEEIDWIGLSYGMQKPTFSFAGTKALQQNPDYHTQYLIPHPEKPFDWLDGYIARERVNPQGVMVEINQRLEEIRLAEVEANWQIRH